MEELGLLSMLLVSGVGERVVLASLHTFCDAARVGRSKAMLLSRLGNLRGSMV
jgi:hypothetical protein